MSLNIFFLIAGNLLAIACILMIIGVAVYLLQRMIKTKGINSQHRMLDQQQADEIVSTWTLLHH